MIKIIILLITSVLIFNSCKIKAQTENRRELIKSFVLAVEKYDTMKIYEILDTSLYFQIQDKEHLLYSFNYLNKRFKECGINIIDTNIEIKDNEVYSKQYIVPFCTEANEVVGNKSFKLIFTFSEYGNNKKIQYFDFTKSIESLSPTIAPPSH